MNGTEKVVKHLEMIQAVIKRLAINSFLVKGGSIVFVITSQVLFVSYVFFAFHEDIHLTGEDSFAIAEAAMLIFFIFGFWILNGFFLWQERLFRHLYDTVRKQDDTDFIVKFTITFTLARLGNLASACVWELLFIEM